MANTYYRSFIGIVTAGTLLEISLLGHVWRLGLMTVIGGILSGAIVYLADLGRS